jgi:beta-lactamase regulating signal transducer with metallopeptidase domain
MAVTWQLAALALIALVCERALRLRQPRVRHALWWFVLVAPLLLAPGRMALQHRRAMISVEAPAAAVKVATWQVAPELVALPPMPPGAPVGHSVPRRAVLRLTDLLGIAWLVGCAALAVRLAVGHRRVRRLLAESIPAESESAREMLSALAAQAGIRGEVALRVSEVIGSPVLYGWRRPIVVVPKGWLESLAADELRAVLAHEVAHVKRRDSLANTIQRLIEIPLFFHPGVWLASRRITLAREELCDSWALSLGTDAVSYARSLAAVAERTQSAFAPVSLGIAEGRFTLLRRVEAIMTMGSVKRISRPLVIAVIAVGLVSAAALSAVQVRSESPAATAPGGLQADDIAQLREIESQLKGLALAMLMYVQDSGGQFPQTEDMEQIWGLLAPYLKSPAAFTHRVRYVLPAGLHVGTIEVPAATPMMIVDDHPKYIVTAYTDGHVDDEEKKVIPLDELPDSEKRIVEFTVTYENGEPAAGARIQLVGGGGEPSVTNSQGFARGMVTRMGQAAFYITSADGREDALPAVFFTGPLTTKRVVLHARGSVADTVPTPTAAHSGIVYDTIDLKYADAWYVAWLFGKADLPAAGETAKDRGSLAMMLPEGIRTLTPVGSSGLPSKQLLVAGTAGAVARLREIIDLLDREVQQVLVEVSFFAAPQAEASKLRTHRVATGPLPTSTVFVPRGSRGSEGGVEFYERRLATANLGLRYVVIPAMRNAPQMILAITPRVNGDRTVTLTLALSIPDQTLEAAELPGGSPVWEKVVCAQSSEAFALEVTHGSWAGTLAIRPLLVPQ